MRCKLSMFGILVECLAYVFGYFQSFLSNSSKPHSALKKKYSSIANHFVGEGVAKNDSRTVCLKTHLNPSDMCTNSLPSDEKRTFLQAIFFAMLGNFSFLFVT